MVLSVVWLSILPSLWLQAPVHSFSAAPLFGTARNPTRLLSTTEKKKEQTQEEKLLAEPSLKDDPGINSATDASAPNPDADGLPFWWEAVWKLDMMQTGQAGDEIIFGDSANVLRTNIEQIYGGYPSLDGCPLAEGEFRIQRE